MYVCIDGKKISRLDPSHPALRGFEVEYKWDSVQEEDFELGVATLFLSAVLGFFLIFFLTVCRYSTCTICMYVCTVCMCCILHVYICVYARPKSMYACIAICNYVCM